MKRLLSAAVLAVSMLAAATPAGFAAVDNQIDPLCRADHAGSGYQRPGGYCDLLANNWSLTPTGSGNPSCAGEHEVWSWEAKGCVCVHPS